MSLTTYKKAIILLLLLTFSGQSLAAMMMSCQLKNMPASVAQEDMTHHHMMGMEHKAPSDSDVHKTNHADCCKTLCHCLTGNCSIAAINASAPILELNYDTESDSPYLTLREAQQISSLYRPPIFR